MAVEITVFDGANSIGGSKIHLLSGEVGLFLDFGTNFKKYGLYFEEFLQPRSARGIYDLLTLKLIPHFENIYRKDLLPPDLKIESGIRPKVEAIFLSHAHLDHSGNIGLLDSCFPLYSSSMTAVICKAMQDSGQSGFEGEAIYISPRGPVKDNPLAIGVQRGESCVSRPVYLVDNAKSDDPPANAWHWRAGLDSFWQTTYSTKKLESLLPFPANFKIGDMNFKAFPVDHSIFGATCFAFETEAGWIAYTGDFRLHGERGNLSQICFEELAKLKPKALIVEGTNLSVDRHGLFVVRHDIKEKKRTTEEEVYSNCLREVNDANGKLVVADFGPRNIERLLTFLNIARETNRKLVVTPKDVYLLHAMRLVDKNIPDVLADFHLYIFDEIKATRNLWERDLIGVLYRGKYIKADEIKKNQQGFILAFSFWDLKHLLDIKPDGGIYIYSTSEAFTEEQKIDIQRLKNWLDFFGLRAVGFEVNNGGIKFLSGYHASGHISGGELIQVLKELKPEYVIPVHTEHPELFIQYLKNDMKVIIPKEGKPISF